MAKPKISCTFKYDFARSFTIVQILNCMPTWDHLTSFPDDDHLYFHTTCAIIHLLLLLPKYYRFIYCNSIQYFSLMCSITVHFNVTQYQNIYSVINDVHSNTLLWILVLVKIGVFYLLDLFSSIHTSISYNLPSMLESWYHPPPVFEDVGVWCTFYLSLHVQGHPRSINEKCYVDCLSDFLSMYFTQIYSP